MALGDNGKPNGNGPNGSKLRFSIDLSFTTLVHAAQVVAVVGGIIYAIIEFRVTSVRSEQQAAAQTAAQAAQQKATTEKLEEIERAFRGGAEDIRRQLSTLPAQAARLDQIERQQTRIESEADSQRDKFEARLDAMMREISSLRAELGHAATSGGR